MPSDFKPGLYLHYKGNYYIALDTVRHSETEELLVLYRSEKNPQLWVRPLSMFMESVDLDGETKARFEFIEALP